MYKNRISEAKNALKQGELIILIDDIKHRGSVFIGAAEKVNSYSVNLMTKFGRGLVCACITEKRAKELELAYMVNEKNQYKSDLPFTVSVDFCTTTTGISSIERSDTIKAFVGENVIAKDFKRPGHIFPLVCKNKRLLENISFHDAAVEFVVSCSYKPVAYMCHILNAHGAPACIEETKEVANKLNFSFIYMSDLLKLNESIISTINGKVVHGKQLGREIGFPTANLALKGESDLDKGVYGVTVYHKQQEYLGVMNVGSRPTILDDGNLTHEIHILDFNQYIYEDDLKVNVCFFLREEISFPSIKHLIEQINRDVVNVKDRFKFCKTKKLVKG